MEVVIEEIRNDHIHSKTTYTSIDPDFSFPLREDVKIQLLATAKMLQHSPCFIAFPI